MNPTQNDPMIPADPSRPKPGWTLHILSPEESERLLREEPRIPIDVVLADLERLVAASPPDA